MNVGFHNFAASAREPKISGVALTAAAVGGTDPRLDRGLQKREGIEHQGWHFRESCRRSGTDLGSEPGFVQSLELHKECFGM